MTKAEIQIEHERLIREYERSYGVYVGSASCTIATNGRAFDKAKRALWAFEEKHKDVVKPSEVLA